MKMSNAASYAFARVGRRFKSSGQIAACDKHNERERETPNADINKSASNECFVGNNGKSLIDLVWEQIGDNGGKKIRTSADPKHSAVLAFEMTLSASPEYFRPDNPGAAGEWQMDRLKAWEQLSAQWLKDTYGNNLVRATFHRDESTPHIHAVIVPLNEKGHINAKTYIGGREKLAALQDSYAKAMQPLGLSRGIRGSRVQHEKIQDYYKSVNQADYSDLSVDELRAIAADSQRQIQRRNEYEKTALALSEENHQLKQKLAVQQNQIVQLQKLVDKSNELRVISLPEVALKLGMQPSEFDANRWYSSAHSITIDGPQFRVAGEVDKGHGAIDLVMRIKDCSFPEALIWLERQLGAGAARAAATEQVHMITAVMAAQRFIPPVQSKAQWPAVRNRLLKQTYLPSRLIDQLHDEGLIYADAESNAVFLERNTEGDVAGAVQRDANGEFRRIENSDDAAAFYIVYPDNQLLERPDRVVITDSPTEALAKLTIERIARPKQRNQYQSIGGHKAPLEQSRGVAQVSIALSGSGQSNIGNNRVAEAIYKVIPWATNEQPTESHQAQLKAEIDQLRKGLKLSSSKSKEQKSQRSLRKDKTKDQGMGM